MADKIKIKNDGDEYEPSDSEDDYSEEEKELLQKVREGRKRDEDPQKEVMAFDESDSDEEEDDDVGELMGDSDIEGAQNDDGDMPDAMDWGNKSRNYYNTDFVDQDYSAYDEREEEMAKQEEEEAKVIQLRLAKQMREEDFLLDDDIMKTAIATDTSAAEELGKSTKIKADLAGLSQSEREKLFKQDSPEFTGLIADYKVNMDECQTLLSPVMQYVVEHNVPMIPALEFAQLYRNIALTYSSNVLFYLLLKAKRVPVRNHPILKKLLQLKKLQLQLKDKYDNIIRPQLEALLERIVDGDKFEVLEAKPKTAVVKLKKKKLSILDEYSEPVGKRCKLDDTAEHSENDDTASSDDEEGGAEEGDEEVAEKNYENERRGITYQIAKNKGLMPSRKKELRNPRVKHRSKFRKALIRRKGAVPTARRETKRYGGEISGIKAGVSKSIKFKS